MLQGSGAACMCGAGYTQQWRPTWWCVSTCFFVKLWVSLSMLQGSGAVGPEESVLQGSGAACMCGTGYTQQWRPTWWLSPLVSFSSCGCLKGK